MKIEKITVAAIVEGNRFRLIDKQGRRIQRYARRESIGMPNKALLQKIAWLRAIELRLKNFHKSVATSRMDPWLKQAATLEKSIRLRMKERSLKGGHKQCDKWKSTTWHDASLRMVGHAYNHFCNCLQSPWKRWANQVAKNQQKRVESRYGKSNYSIENT